MCVSVCACNESMRSEWGTRETKMMVQEHQTRFLMRFEESQKGTQSNCVSNRLNEEEREKDTAEWIQYHSSTQKIINADDDTDVHGNDYYYNCYQGFQLQLLWLERILRFVINRCCCYYFSHLVSTLCRSQSHAHTHTNKQVQTVSILDKMSRAIQANFVIRRVNKTVTFNTHTYTQTLVLVFSLELAFVKRKMNQWKCVSVYDWTKMVRKWLRK